MSKDLELLSVYFTIPKPNSPPIKPDYAVCDIHVSDGLDYTLPGKWPCPDIKERIQRFETFHCSFTTAAKALFFYIHEDGRIRLGFSKLDELEDKAPLIIRAILECNDIDSVKTLTLHFGVEKTTFTYADGKLQKKLKLKPVIMTIVTQIPDGTGKGVNRVQVTGGLDSIFPPSQYQSEDKLKAEFEKIRILSQAINVEQYLVAGIDFQYVNVPLAKQQSKCIGEAICEYNDLPEGTEVYIVLNGNKKHFTYIGKELQPDPEPEPAPDPEPPPREVIELSAIFLLDRINTMRPDHEFDDSLGHIFVIKDYDSFADRCFNPLNYTRGFRWAAWLSKQLLKHRRKAFSNN